MVSDLLIVAVAVVVLVVVAVLAYWLVLKRSKRAPAGSPSGSEKGKTAGRGRTDALGPLIPLERGEDIRSTWDGEWGGSKVRVVLTNHRFFLCHEPGTLSSVLDYQIPGTIYRLEEMPAPRWATDGRRWLEVSGTRVDLLGRGPREAGSEVEKARVERLSELGLAPRSGQ